MMRRPWLASVALLLACGDSDDPAAPVTIYVREGGVSGSAGSAGGAEEEAGAAGEAGSVGGADGGAGESGAPAGGAGTAGADHGGAAGGPTGSSGSDGTSAGSGGSGAGGKGGTAGKSGAAGKAGGGGKGGSGGTGGTAGKGGSGGKSGAAGTGGSAGKGGGGQAGAGGSAGGSGGGGAGGSVPGECPVEMAFVPDGGFCVDRWEAQVEVQGGDGSWGLHSPYETLDSITEPTRARSVEGVAPQGYISGVQAKAACLGAGKRLCTYDEHLTACAGPEDFTWPYGETRIVGKCNEGREKHPVIEMFGSGATFNNTELNDPGLNQLPDSLAETGARTECVSAYGAYDLAGNLHEWIEDPAGSFVGGFYVDAVKNFPGCLYKTTAHAFSYHDYSTGFRCCRDP